MTDQNTITVRVVDPPDAVACQHGGTIQFDVESTAPYPHVVVLGFQDGVIVLTAQVPMWTASPLFNKPVKLESAAWTGGPAVLHVQLISTKADGTHPRTLATLVTSAAG